MRPYQPSNYSNAPTSYGANNSMSNPSLGSNQSSGTNPSSKQPTWANNVADLGGGIGQLLASLFGQNPGDAANDYLKQIPGQVTPLMQPWMQGGQNALSQILGQLGPLLSNPGALQNQFGQGYHQSPGYQFSVDQATKAANNAAAAGGYLGSPQAQQSMAQTVTGLADQDYNNWMQNTLGLYNQGLGLGQNISQQGLTSSDSLAKMLSDALGSQASFAYAGAQGQNQGMGGGIGGILGGLGGILGHMFGL